jgi:hypothetical protein
MKAYVIALETIRDQAMFADYAKGVVATLGLIRRSIAPSDASRKMSRPRPARRA